MRCFVRMSGLGGQGIVTAANIIGSAAVLDGLHAVVNPFFGAEKRLAPTESYVRISDEPVFDAGEILAPDVILIFHPDVILKGKCYTMPFFSGITPGGVIIVNSEREIVFAQDEAERLADLEVHVRFFPATEIAREVGGTELATNVVMLGAFVGVTGVVSAASMQQALAERFGGKAKFVASGTTAALDEAARARHDKIENLLATNRRVLEEAIARAASLTASDTG